MQTVLEQGSIDKPLTFDVGLMQLSFIPVCSLNTCNLSVKLCRGFACVCVCLSATLIHLVQPCIFYSLDVQHCTCFLYSSYVPFCNVMFSLKLFIFPFCSFMYIVLYSSSFPPPPPTTSSIYPSIFPSLSSLPFPLFFSPCR